LKCLITSGATSSKSQVSPFSTPSHSFSEKSPFILDTEGGLVHFFSVKDDKKPYQTLSLTNAELLPHEDIVVNKDTGEKRQCFTV
jgi:hypothetical protein